MKAFWDRCAQGKNFGDMLTPWIWRKVHGEVLEWAPLPSADLVAVGSLVEGIPQGWRGTVLGPGLMFEGSRRDLRAARVLALRGPLTRERVELVGEEPVLADPGLLLGAFAPQGERYRAGGRERVGREFAEQAEEVHPNRPGSSSREAAGGRAVFSGGQARAARSSEACTGPDRSGVTGVSPWNPTQPAPTARTDHPGAPSM